MEASKIRINEYAINVPVLVDFSLSERFNLEAGPQAGFIFKDNSKIVKGRGDYGSFEIEGEGDNDLQISLAFVFGINYKITKDICLEKNPPLEEIAHGHKIACWVDIKTGELR